MSEQKPGPSPEEHSDYRKYPGMGSYGNSGQYPNIEWGTDINLANLVQTLWRRKITIAVTTSIVVLASLSYSMTRTASFSSSGRVLLEGARSPSGILGELSLLSSAPLAAAESEVIASREIAYRIVASPQEDPLGLGLRVRVDDIDQYSPWGIFSRSLSEERLSGSLSARLITPTTFQKSPPAIVSFTAPDQGVIRWERLFNAMPKRFNLRDGPVGFGDALTLFQPEGDLSGRDFRIRWTTTRAAAEGLLSRLEAKETSRGSGVLRISYTDSDPERAAQVVNRIISAYMDQSRERLAGRARKTVAYIEGQVKRIQADLEQAEKALVDFQERENAALLSDSARAVVARMSELELEQAKLAMLIESQSGLVQAMERGENAEEVAAGTELDPLTASMLQELAGLVAQASFLAEEHTEEWPQLRQLRAQISQLRSNIAGASRARSRALLRQEESLGAALDRWQGQLDGLPATERKLAKFQRKAESFEKIYTYLLAEEQQARIAENSAIGAVSVVDWAVPALQRTTPKITLSTLISIAFGLCLGLVIAVWRENNKRTILSAAQLEAITGLPSWGIIPDFQRGGTRSKAASDAEFFLALRDAPDSATAESYRALRANLSFASKGGKIKTITITSAAQGEGKSTTIADLAIALANSSSSVLLVDSDLRRPVIHKMFACPQSPGLAETIKDGTPWQDTIQHETGIANLDILPAGEVHGINPGDLLAIPSVLTLVDSLKESYDFVLFDVPPVLAVADAASFLNHLDAIVLLSRYDYSPESAVAGAQHRLALAGAPAIGSLLNGLRASRLGGKYGHGYGYESGHKYGGKARG